MVKAGKIILWAAAFAFLGILLLVIYAADTGAHYPATPSNVAGGGTAWVNPTNATAADSVYTTASFGAGPTNISDAVLYLCQSQGVNCSTSKADTVTTWSGTNGPVYYGGSSDLWGVTLTVAQINASTLIIEFEAQLNGGASGTTDWLMCSNFGFSVPSGSTVNGYYATITKYANNPSPAVAYVDAVALTVYYTPPVRPYPYIINYSNLFGPFIIWRNENPGIQSQTRSAGKISVR